jgi:protein gp37
MSDRSKIAWCDATWNPLRGCSRVSPGCQNCYAERMCARGLPGLKLPTTGEDFAIMTPQGPHWTGQVELIESAPGIPMRWRKPRRIFVNSMSDTFHERLNDTQVGRVFESMCCVPQHTFIVCTKRAKRMREFMTTHTKSGGPLAPGTVWCCSHIWFLVSAEDQQRADERIPELLATPAAVRGISLEPILGPVDLRKLKRLDYSLDSAGAEVYPLLGLAAIPDCDWKIPKLDWVIVGGESGPGARPCNVEWIRDVVRQCREAGVACFVKQLGARPICPVRPGYEPIPMRLVDRAGADPSEWPADLRVQQFPEVRRG